MKHLHIPFNDEEFKLITKAKGNRSWRDVILEWADRDLKQVAN